MDKKLYKLCKIVGRDLAKLHKGDTASALWPFIPNEAEYYAGRLFIKNLYETISKLKQKGYNVKQIAKLFGHSSKMAQYFTLFHSAEILDINERKELAKDIINFIEYYREDPFCKEGLNRLKEAPPLPQLSTNKNLINSGEKLMAMILLYLEILYPTMMRMGHEFHGPYNINGKKIFIKEFFNLDPSSLDIGNMFPVKNIKIIEEINSDIELDFFNHLFKSSKKKGIAIFINGNQKNLRGLEKDIKKMEESIAKIIQKCSKFTREEWFKVYARGIFNSFCSLKKELGEKCKVPKELFEKIDNEDFSLPIDKIVEFNKRHTKDQLEKIITNSFLKIFSLKDE